MEDEILKVVLEAWNRPFTTRSDFARHNAEIVAVCACSGYITTRITADAFGNVWKTTTEGLGLLEEAAADISLERFDNDDL